MVGIKSIILGSRVLGRGMHMVAMQDGVMAVGMHEGVHGLVSGSSSNASGGNQNNGNESIT